LVKAGFTLVEMLVVLAILALAMAVVPSFLARGQGKAELTATAREVAAALRETRSLALREGHSEAFVIDDVASAFRVGAEGVAHRLPTGLRLSVVPVSDPQNPATVSSIRFFSDGSSTGGRLELLQGNRRTGVAVDWLTGRVSLDAGAR
jgi:general secretion pathway protein H